MTKAPPPGQTTTRKVTLIVLVAVALATVFVLPQFVSDPWVTGDPEALAPVPEASPSAVPPSTAAELTQYRQDSQGILAEIVGLRDRLQQSAVERWAQADFQQALAQIEIGDESYSYGNYRESLEQFKQARELLVKIELEGQQVLADAKAEAETAIESLNPNAASTAIDLAVAMAPEDPQVESLRQRADLLPRVAALVEVGDEAMERDHYEKAREAYQQAVGLDPAHQRANEALAAAQGEVTGSAFRAQMSSGFTAMERQDYDTARAAFRQAGRIQPGDPSVRKALEQVDNLESGDYVSTELERAASLESREQWREAVSIYETLLQRDPSLTDARVRLIPSQVRAELDERLTGYIAEPLKLSSQAEYQAALTTLEDARGIASPGPQLTGQIAELDKLVKRASTPVSVLFRSDQQTRVILYRVADLGQFDQKSVQLRPGKYIAAGSRNGYRDVLVEFTVTGDAPAEPIVVRCEEPVG
jgi:tetratricopeptide (TPR) repeat protein